MLATLLRAEVDGRERPATGAASCRTRMRFVRPGVAIALGRQRGGEAERQTSSGVTEKEAYLGGTLMLCLTADRWARYDAGVERSEARIRPRSGWAVQARMSRVELELAETCCSTGWGGIWRRRSGDG